MAVPVTTEYRRRLQEQGVGNVESFPVLKIKHDTLIPDGAFAETQAVYLNPNQALVERLDALLHEKNVGVVAHFYMGPELQGILSGCKWPHIFTADSLAMGDAAIKMAQAGVKAVVVLGVDFMSENVRAQMDAFNLSHVPVFRVCAEEIGCSLAESADKPAYGRYLTGAAQVPNSLHVVYINTGLLTKAKAHALVPTITCTSSNVVRLILQAFAQVPNINVWFGPDTYMGHNLATLFNTLKDMDDEAIKSVHPEHNTQTMQGVCERFHSFEEGNCIVHHMFGEDVAKKIKKWYPDAYVTAHLEVPGSMFQVALEAQHKGKGVVGATSDILNFIYKKVEETVNSSNPESLPKLQFVLGTEAGMITPIVKKVQALLEKHHSADKADKPLEVDIIFPVASEAVCQDSESGLGIVPGVGGGEGCSAAGGCATCPYMKMNTLKSLIELVEKFSAADITELDALQPKKYTQLVRKRAAAQVGGESIMHMRGYQQTKQLPEDLVHDIQTRSGIPEKVKWVKDEGLDW